MIRTAWNSVMNAEQNPLLALPRITRFQMMTVLAFMWSCIFCISAGLYVWIPEFVFGHVVLLLLGIFGTSFIFRTNSSRG